MTTSPLQITGIEHAEEGGPLNALIDFYGAFNTRDLSGLATNWINDDRPSMDNPIGGIRRGWDAIREGYIRIFEGATEVRVAFQDYASVGGSDWNLFVGREKGFCRKADTRLDLSFRTSRLFVREEGGWRQLHHHGSVEEPTMLANYQRLIFGAPL